MKKEVVSGSALDWFLLKEQATHLQEGRDDHQQGDVVKNILFPHHIKITFSKKIHQCGLSSDQIEIRKRHSDLIFIVFSKVMFPRKSTSVNCQVIK
ncbi:unnamed protein product, partial [Larinioides sclopetarius]